jgi:ABC-type lipoprotein release transport system permease subunit
LLWLGASLVAAAASLLPAWGAMRLSVREALH